MKLPSTYRIRTRYQGGSRPHSWGTRRSPAFPPLRCSNPWITWYFWIMALSPLCHQWSARPTASPRSLLHTNSRRWEKFGSYLQLRLLKSDRTILVDGKCTESLMCLFNLFLVGTQCRIALKVVCWGLVSKLFLAERARYLRDILGNLCLGSLFLDHLHLIHPGIRHRHPIYLHYGGWLH